MPSGTWDMLITNIRSKLELELEHLSKKKDIPCGIQVLFYERRKCILLLSEISLVRVQQRKEYEF